MFLTANKINTTTIISVDSNSNGARYLIDGNTRYRFITSGSSQSVAMISISFSSAVVLSHILIQNHNLDEFYIYRDNTTTGCLFFTCSNTSVDTWVTFDSTTASSIQLVMGRTMILNDEKRVGEFACLEKKLDFDVNPSINNFKYFFDRLQVSQEMPDGGKAVYNIRDNFQSKIEWTYITNSFRNSLLSIYNESVPFYFVPEGTETSWDGIGNEMEWVGPFDFKSSTNVEANGFTGNLNLKQASRQR